MGIFKKANNIYITVRDTYTSISGSSYEEAEEVIIEATNGDLELVSQKKVIMQGLGNNSDTQETEEQREEEKEHTIIINKKGRLEVVIDVVISILKFIFAALSVVLIAIAIITLIYKDTREALFYVLDNTLGEILSMIKL